MIDLLIMDFGVYMISNILVITWQKKTTFSSQTFGEVRNPKEHTGVTFWKTLTTLNDSQT